jgi:hypothetical protein
MATPGPLAAHVPMAGPGLRSLSNASTRSEAQPPSPRPKPGCSTASRSPRPTAHRHPPLPPPAPRTPRQVRAASPDAPPPVPRCPRSERSSPIRRHRHRQASGGAVPARAYHARGTTIRPARPRTCSARQPRADPLGRPPRSHLRPPNQRLLFPRRLAGGARKSETAWAPLSLSRAADALHNPWYAGAYVYSRGRWRKLPDGRVRHKPGDGDRGPYEA